MKIDQIFVVLSLRFQEFDDHRDADDAVYELNGKELLNERVHVEYARGPSRGRGGGRGGGFGGDRGGRGFSDRGNSRYESRGGRGGDRSSGMSYSEK